MATTTALSSTSPAATTTANSIVIPRLTASHLQQLADKKYVVIPNFIADASLIAALRSDVQALRQHGGKFRTAKIGQDSTNALNTDIRVAETCFLGPAKHSDVPSAAREQLYAVLDGVRRDLTTFTKSPLDASLTELLYAYYPEGGFYRRHRDAVPGSASTLRRYSLLLYLNEHDWDAARDGGCLRLHLGADNNDDTDDSNKEHGNTDDSDVFVDVEPAGGTLVLFQSDALPHEVLDTVRERVAVVGWYNRPVRGVADAVELAGDAVTTRLTMAAVSLGLVTVGVLSLLGD